MYKSQLLSQLFGVCALFVAHMLLALPAYATAGCDVGPTLRGFAYLYEKPSTTSRKIRKIRDGEMVSLWLDNVASPSRSWTAVSHDPKGSRRHGVGDRGWMLVWDLHTDTCG